MGLLSAAVNGICMGSIYGLIALGLSLIFGIMRIINFAHGALLMLAMILSYWFWRLSGANPYFLVVVIAPLMFVMGYACERVIIKPVLDKEQDVREPIGVLLLTAGLAVAVENLVLMTFGADYVMAQSNLSGRTYAFGDLLVSAPRLHALVITMLVTLAFHLLLQRTELGRAIRATGQDRTAATLMGLNIANVYAVAFGLGTALLSVAGIVLIPFYYAHATVGQVFMTKAFIVVVLGGLGSIPGALVGGLIIGLIESIAAQYMTATVTAVLVYFTFLVVLFFKPSGIFGSPYEW